MPLDYVKFEKFLAEHEKFHATQNDKNVKTFNGSKFIEVQRRKKTELGSGTTVLRYWIINLGRKYFVEDQNGVRANFNHMPVNDSFYITSVVPKMRTIFNTIVLKHLYLAEVTSIFVL